MIILTLRKVLIQYHFGLLMALSFLFFSCTKDKVAIKNIEKQLLNPANTFSALSAKGSSISDYDLYRGVIFASGPLVSQIQSLKETKTIKDLFIKNSQESDKEVLMQRTIINDIQANNPHFLKYFKAEIISGNHLRVGAAVDSGTKMMINSFCNIQGFSDNQNINFKNSTHSLNEDDFIEIGRIGDDLKANYITKEKALSQIQAIFPNIHSTPDGLGNATTTSSVNQNECFVLGVIFAVAVVVVGYVALALALHSAVGVRFAVAYTVHIKATGAMEKIENKSHSSLLLIDDLAKYSF
jgi:SdpC family antimicrobial peptide